jgi:glycosyltransferase involved in cell wall biosynthesis
MARGQRAPLIQAPGADTTIMEMIKLLSVIEAGTVTGPAKLFLDFCRHVQAPAGEWDDLPRVSASIVTFLRGRSIQRHTNGAPAPASKASPNEFVAAAHRYGVEVDLLGERCQFDPRVITNLRRVVKQRAPDIIETQHVKSHFLMRLSGLAREYPWVALHHGYTTTDLKMRAYNQFDRWSLRKADRVITVCDAFALQLARMGVSSDQIRVLHSAIGSDWAPSERRENASALKARLGLDPEVQVVLAVGRLSREKGHVDLVAAMDHLRRIPPTTRAALVIVGDGPERQRIAQAAVSLGLDKQVLFAGQVDAVGAYYDAADILALPSHSEGSPNVLLEAMMARLPIVATAVGGVPEIVRDNESALLVRPRDPSSMTAAISRLLVDRQLAQRLAANAHSSVIVRHSPENRMRSLVEIYCQLMAQGR